MIEQSVSLASSGVVKVPGYEQLLRFGYTKNRGVYRLAVTASGEWDGLTIRAFWHTPGRKDPPSSLVADGYVDVPASVTAQSGNGCITFEGSDGTKTVTSDDLRYRVSANSGTEDGTMPEPGTPAWQQLVDVVHTNAAAAEQARKGAETAADRAESAADRAESAADRAESAQQKTEEVRTDALLKIGAAKADALKAVDAKQTAATAAVESTQKKALNAVTAAQSTAVKAVYDAQSTATQAVQTAQTDAVSAVEKAGSEVLASIPEDYQNTVQKVEKLKTEKAEIDDSTVGLDAWSSKHIVDMLCPPIEETGNPVQCYPVAGYPLGCKVSWEPTQEGTGDPSPDNIRPIKGRDSVTVERCGENLLHIAPFSTVTKNDVTFEYVPDGGVRIQGTASANTDSPTFPVGHLPPGKYYGLYMDTGIAASIVVVRAGKNLWLNAKGTFEIIQGDIVKYWYMVANNGNTANTTVYPYIVHGTTPPTTCSPYTGQTATLTLHHTIYGGTVDAVTGEGQETWKLLTLDGTEAWTSESTKVSGKHGYILREKNIQTTTTPNLKGQIVCNKYVTRSANDTYTNHTGISVENGNNKYFRIYDEAYADQSVSAWKSYLAAQYAAGTPVQVCYKLADPVSFTATGAQPIPALSGVNTVLTDADSATVTGRADPIKRITDLEDAVASMT